MSESLHIEQPNLTAELPSLELVRLFADFSKKTAKNQKLDKSEVLNGLALSRELRNNANIGQSLYYLSTIHYADKNYQQALILLDEAQKLLKKETKPLILLKCLELSGKIYHDLEDFEMALQIYFEALNLASNNLALEYYKGNLHHNIGLAFKSTRDFDTAITHFRKFLEISEKFERPREIAEANFELGNILTWADQLGEAGIFLKKATAQSIELSDVKLEVYTLASRAILKTKLRQFNFAFNLFEEALEKSKELNNEDIVANILKSKGRLFLEMGQPEHAIFLLDEAFVIAEKLKSNQILLMVYQSYALAFEQLKEFEKALHYNKLHFALEKKMIEERGKTRVQGLQLKFDMEEVLKENEIFKLKNVVLQQAHDKISQQKSEIEIINKDLTSSLSYASKIQQAILPRKEEIDETLPNHFLLLNPVNMVSGDFYWYFNSDSHSYIAAVDCTGHGVPGAFMSMIGNTLLNELVNANRDIEPNELLRLLNLEIKKSLRQDLSEIDNNDGMDISLCRIDKATGNVVIAAANRPVYIYRNADSTIEEIKLDKGSLGGFHSNSERQFTSFNVTLNQGDTIYLFTDGITDQFGEATGKKLRPINFRNWILEGAQLDLSTQKEFFINKMSEWQGSEAQVDDMLLIGFTF
jgi:serine phosphatase RsbU (regulator of sigma subunit)